MTSRPYSRLVLRVSPSGSAGTAPHHTAAKRIGCFLPFLAWLPEEDRKFLLAAEGLGNSQKAEVAWLERKGYRYVERDVSPWLSTCLEEVHLEAVVPTQVHMGPRPAPEASSPGAEGRDCRDVDLPGAVALYGGLKPSRTKKAD